MATTREDAEELLELVNADPSRVVSAGRSMLDDAEDPASRSILSRAVGSALRAQRDPTSALPHLEHAVDEAERATNDRLLGQAKLSYALALAYLGSTHAADAQLDQALPLLDGLDLADLRFQRALVKQLTGRFAEALDEVDQALQIFTSLGHLEWEADALYNRAVLNGYLGRLDDANADLDRCHDVFTELEDALGVAFVAHNRAWLQHLAGDVVACLSGYVEAERLLAAEGFAVETALTDRCEALLSAGLFGEAAEVACDAAGALVARDMQLELAECRIMLARAELARGQLDEARNATRLARAQFIEHGKPGWVLRADLLELRIAMTSGAVDDQLFEAVEQVVEELTKQPVVEWRVSAELLGSRIATRLGASVDEAGLVRLRRAALPLHLRAELDLALAEVRRAAGRTAAAARSVTSGLEHIRGIRQLAHAAELSAALSRLQTELLEVGVELASERGDSRRIHLLAERVTETQRPSSADSRTSAEVAELLMRLRGLDHAIAGAENELRDTAVLLSERNVIERRVAETRRRGRSAKRDRSTSSHPLHPNVVGRRYLSVGGRVLAVELRHNRSTSLELGPVEEVSTCSGRLAFNVRSALRSDRGSTERVKLYAARLDELLGHPGAYGDGAINIVPFAGSSWVPWALLPSMRTRRWRIVRSLRIDGHDNVAEADDPPKLLIADNGDRVLLVAGPELQTGDDEISGLRRVYPTAQVLGSTAATCEKVLSVMDGSDLVHLSAHVVVNTESPMFSSVTLTDGRLSLHEFESLVQPPRVAVLASCQAARSVAVGTSFLGIADYLGLMGVEDVVSPGCHIPDDEDTSAVMLVLHRNLSRGMEPAAALNAVVQDNSLTERQVLVARCLVAYRSKPPRVDALSS